MRYLFDAWDGFKDRLQGKSLYIFLDYDGTLVPIRESPDPERSLLPESVGKVLASLRAKGYRIAIVSGRSLKDLKRMVGMSGLIYSGNHGLEMEGPKIKFENLVSLKSRRLIKKLKYLLIERLSGMKGVFLEDKGLTFSLHYRLVRDDEMPMVINAFNYAVRQYVDRGEIRVNQGKKIFEVKPSVNWDKGRMVLWLIARQGFATGRKEIFPVYIGDDTTDEDAFKALRGKGATVFVGRPKKSFAEYYVKNPSEVRGLLMRIARINKEKASCRN